MRSSRRFFLLLLAGATLAACSEAPTDLAGHCSIWGSWPND